MITPPTRHQLLLLMLLAPAAGFLPFPKLPFPAAPVRLAAKVSFRQGNAKDAPLISRSMQEARMNPTFLNPANFIVAEQGGQRKETGMAEVVGFGQVRPVVGSKERVCELASVYVIPQARGQGIGSQIVAKLVEHFVRGASSRDGGSSDSTVLRRLVLLTLADTASFYTRHGFTVLPDPVRAQPPLPPLLILEYLAGGVVARLSRGPGTKLVCMQLLPQREGGAASTAKSPGSRR